MSEHAMLFTVLLSGDETGGQFGVFTMPGFDWSDAQD